MTIYKLHSILYNTCFFSFSFLFFLSDSAVSFELFNSFCNRCIYSSRSLKKQYVMFICMYLYCKLGYAIYITSTCLIYKKPHVTVATSGTEVIMGNSSQPVWFIRSLTWLLLLVEQIFCENLYCPMQIH